MNISVIGAGSWGTAIAHIISKNNNLTWWVRREKLAKQIVNKKRNTKYLTNCKINTKNIYVTTDLTSALSEATIIIVAVPSSFVKTVFNDHAALLDNKILLSATKGVLPDLLITPKQYFSNLSNKIEYGVISGPCHAEEVAQEKTSFLTISSNIPPRKNDFVKVFNTPFINVKISSDIIGCEYASILKNIYAIMVGIASGLGYGDNFLAVLITASTNELKRLLNHLDPKERSVSQPAYLGDLLVTCYSTYSRNRSLGTAIGKGLSVENAIEDMTMVAEGYSATASLKKIITQMKIKKEAPIVMRTYNILYLEKEPKKEIKQLFKVMS